VHHPKYLPCAATSFKCRPCHLVCAAAAFSGGAVSPARALGPAIVFHCHWNKVWIYVLGEVAGCIVAGLLACPLYGGHAKYLDPLIRALPFSTAQGSPLWAPTMKHEPLLLRF